MRKYSYERDGQRHEGEDRHRDPPRSRPGRTGEVDRTPCNTTEQATPARDASAFTSLEPSRPVAAPAIGM